MMTALLAQVEQWVPVTEHFGWFAPELAWVCTLCLLMVAPLIVGRNAKTTGAVALVGLLVTGWLTYRTSGFVAGAGLSGLSPEMGGLLIVDKLSVFFKMLLIVFLIGVTILWWAGSSDTEKDTPEFFVLLIGSALGMALMVSSLNLLMIVVAMEFASLPSYAMVGFDKKNRMSAEGSLKYMIFGAISAAVMLYGISLLYGQFGSLNVAVIAGAIAERLASGSEVLIVAFGMFCFFVGVGFKISAVPFHFWCPDAFQGARIEVTTWLSVASKGAGLLLLLRLVHALSGAVSHEGTMTAVSWTIGIIAAATCTVGNLSAYKQNSVKRMLAYSSIAHAGYMLMAASIFLKPGDDAGSFSAIGAVLFYIVVYMFMNLGAFGVTALLGWRNGGDDSMSAFSGLMRRAPILAVPMLFCLISLVGLPPFAGFVGKWWLLVALGHAGGTLCWILIVVAVINTLISLWYYMRVVIQMMLKDDGGDPVAVPPLGAGLVNVCGAALIIMLVWSQGLKDEADNYAKNLFNPQATAAVADAVASAEPID